MTALTGAALGLRWACAAREKAEFPP